MTFSIVACDLAEGAWGVAVASKFLAVGSVVPWARAGAGAVATQSFANVRYGPDGLDFLGKGASAEETLARLTADDPQRGLRQAGVVDAAGRAATFTGPGCSAWAGGRAGAGFACQGNILVGAGVVDAMAAAYADARGDLPERLVRALVAGDAAGGDRRGRQSAALYVAKAGAGYGGNHDRWLDLRVDDDPAPVPKIVGMLGLARLHLAKPTEPPVPLDGEVLRDVVAAMRRLGHLEPGEPLTLARFTAFLHAENFEEREHPGQLAIDPGVLAWARRKLREA